MSHVDPGPLASYGSLSDPNLTAYFNNSRMRRHLVKSGLITRKGEIVSEKVFRLNNARKEHQRHVRDLLAQAIVHKALDMERHRQMQVKKELEEIGKIERVRRIRADRAMRGDEDILPLLVPPTPKSDKKKRERPHTVPVGKSAKHSARSLDTETQTQHPQSVGHPALPDNAPYNTRSTRIKTPYPNVEIDDQHLYQLDQEALRTFTLNLSNYDLGSGVSPYNVPVLDPASREIVTAPKTKKKKSKLNRSKQRPSTAIGIVRKTEEQNRLIMANKHSTNLHRREPPMIYRTQPRMLCIITFKYLGQIVHLDCESEDPRDEIQVYQQHCGGENLCVYSGKLLAGNNFTIISQRHRGFPFSLTFYLNGMIAERLSACCEYKHKLGHKLGAKTSHFGFVKVEGAHPCYRCLVARGRLRTTPQQSASSRNKFTKQQPISKKRRSRSEAKDDSDKEERKSADKEADKYDDSFASSSDESSTISSVSSISSTEEEDGDEVSKAKTSDAPLPVKVSEKTTSTPEPVKQVSSRSSSSSSASSIESLKPDSPKVEPVPSKTDSPIPNRRTPTPPQESPKLKRESPPPKQASPKAARESPKLKRDSPQPKHSSSSSDSSSSSSSGVKSSNTSSSDNEAAVYHQPPTVVDSPIRTLIMEKGTIDLSNIDLTQDQVDELCSILIEDSTTVSSVVLRNCDLGDKKLTSILESLASSCENIKMLNIGLNKATRSSMAALVNVVRESQIETIILDDNPVGDNGIEQFMNGLKALLKSTDETGNKSGSFNQLIVLPPSDAEAEKKPSLSCLSLNRIGVEKQGVNFIAEFLAANPDLKFLHLNGNSLSGDSVSGLWKVLSSGQNRHLVALSLAGNQIGNSGMEKFSEQMSSNSLVEKFDFSDNGITNSGADHLLSFARKNDAAKYLFVSRGNTVKRKTLKRIREALQPKKSK